MELTRRTFLKGSGAALAALALPVDAIAAITTAEVPEVPATLPAGVTAYDQVRMGNLPYRVFPEQIEHWNQMLGWDHNRAEWRLADDGTNDMIGTHPHVPERTYA